MNATPDLMEASFKMVTGLAVVVGILLVIWYLTRRFSDNKGNGNPSARIRVMANQCIGLKKHISLVRVPGSILVLGITHDRITCLTKIAETDWPDEQAAMATRNPVSSFVSQLKNEMAGFRKNAGHDGSPV